MGKYYVEIVIKIKDNIMEKNKIKFLYHDLEENIAVENLWAYKYGKYYQIKNIPFFISNIAYDDIVQVEEENGELFFDELITPSGNSTIQIIIFDILKNDSILGNIERLGCGWEGMKNKPYYAINIPKCIDFNKVISYLEEKNNENVLDYKVACIG